MCDWCDQFNEIRRSIEKAMPKASVRVGPLRRFWNWLLY